MEPEKSLTGDRGLWLLAGLALALVLVYNFAGSLGLSDSKKNGPGWLLNPDEIGPVKSLKHYKNEELQVRAQLTESGWRLSHPLEAPADTAALQTWLETVRSPEVKEAFNRRAGRDYGFESAGQKIEVVGETATVTLRGGHSPGPVAGFYVTAGSGRPDTVYLLAASEREEMFPALEELRRSKLFRISSGRVERFTFAPAASGQREYVRVENGWKKTDGNRLSDTGVRKVNSSLRQLLDLEGEEFQPTMGPEELEEKALLELVLETGKKVQVRFGGRNNQQRLLQKRDWPVVSVSDDPLARFRSLP